jgi:hypothetical protein
MTIFIPTSSQIIYLSKAGVLSDASFADPTVGTDQSARIQAILDRAAVNPITVVADVLCKAANLKIRSGTNIEGMGGAYWGNSLIPGPYPKYGFILAPTGNPSTTASLFRNYNWRSPATGSSGSGGGTVVTLYGSNSSTVIDWGNLLDKDISIRNVFCWGNRGTATGKASQGVTTPYDRRFNTSGQLVCPYTFLGVANLRMENLFTYDSPSFTYFSSYAYYVRQKNLVTIDPDWLPGGSQSAGNNVDGTHFIGPCEDILVDGMTSITGDDSVAFNADDGNTDYGGAALAGLHLFGDATTCYRGPIYDAEARNVRSKSGRTLGRVLSGTSRIDRVRLNGSGGKTNTYLWGLDQYTQLGVGNVGRVTIADCEAEGTSATSGWNYGSGIPVGMNVDSLTLRGVRVNNSTMLTSPLVNVSANTLTRLSIDGCLANNVQSVLKVNSGATVTTARIANCDHPAKNAGPIASIVNAGTIGTLCGTGNTLVTLSGTAPTTNALGTT